MSIAPSQRTQVQTFLGGGGAPLPAPAPVSVFDPENARRLFQSQQRTEATRRAGRSAETKADRERKIQSLGAEAKKEGYRVLGDRKGRAYAEKVDTALKLGKPIPLPAEGSSRDKFLQQSLDVLVGPDAKGKELREEGFDVPRKFGEARRKKPNVRTLPSITRDKPSFGIPSSRFPVDRVSAGNDVEDTGPRLVLPQPEPEPEPEPTGGRAFNFPRAFVDRLTTGGSSGSRPTLTPSAEQQFDEFVSSRQSGQTNPFGIVQNTGLASQRSAPTGVGSGLTESQRQRDAQLIAQLEAEPRSSPRGRDSGAGTGIAGNPLKRAGTI